LATTTSSINNALLQLHEISMRFDRQSTRHVFVDPAEPECKTMGHGEHAYGDISTLPQASVVTCFHTKEDLLEIIHTLHSLVQRTPARLLREIVIVDDHSVNELHKDILENYVASVFKDTSIVIYRSPKQLGLIQARSVGIRIAKGPVVMVMDIHFEVQPHWLEGLLWEIKKNRKTLASPYLDWMKPGPNGTWTYEHGSSSCKTFWTWDFGVGFEHASDAARAKIKDKTAAVVSPANIGTFAIDKTFFDEIGAYDEGMWGWGGENVDLALRTWMFGGQVVKVPCSHMAHLEKEGYRDYRSKWYWNTMANFRRVVDLWGDNYTEVFFDYLPDVKKVGAQNITKRLYLKAKAVHNLHWVLTNVYPELMSTVPNINSYAYGGVRNTATKACLDRGGNFVQYPCHYLMNTQGFFWNNLGEMRHKTAIISSISSNGEYILWVNTFINAYGRPDLTKWIHWKGGPIMDSKNDVCLEALAKSEDIVLRPCQFNSSNQQWTFKNYTKEYDDLIGGKISAEQGTWQHKLLRLYRAFHNKPLLSSTTTVTGPSVT
ncbi:putative polypeptide N-acetylgalactosaminyltransferase 9, partial [Lamellibrachia satsuma]